MQEYRIKPVTAQERMYNGVYVDSLGAWLGKIITAQDASGREVTSVEPAMNTTGGRVPAPTHWRSLIIEELPS